METLYIIIISLLVVTTILFIIFIIKNDEYAINVMSFIYAWVIAMVIFTNIVESLSYKQGQVDAIKGKYKYQQMFVYPANDTIAVDTLYVKIKTMKP